MDASEIHEHKIGGGVSVFFFARSYADDRSSAAAYERARAKISGKDNTSLFRVRAPDDGRQLLFVLCGTVAMPGVPVNGLRGEVWSTAPRLTRSARLLAASVRSVRLVP
jgi:hypothetical protein